MPEKNARASRGGRRDRLRNRIQIMLFATALALPAFGYWAGLNDYALLAENRRLAEMPSWPKSAREVSSYPSAFERHFDDHFGFRSFLVGREKRLEWLGARTEVEIQIGRDEWLFQGAADELAGRICIEPTGSVFDRWVEFQNERSVRLQAMGVEYGWIIAPNKHTVHSEMLPPGIQSGAGSCRASGLASAFGGEDLGLVDLRPILASENAGQNLYHRTDTHWNQLGAAFAVREIVDRLRLIFPGIPAFPMDDYQVVIEDEPFEGNLAERLKVYGEVYSEEFLRLEPLSARGAQLSGDASPIDLRVHSRKDRVVQFSTGRPDLPTAIVFHDSFGFAAMEMLAEHFESVQFVSFHGLLDYAMIEEEQPDLVLSLVVELHLQEPPRADVAPAMSKVASAEAARSGAR